MTSVLDASVLWTARITNDNLARLEASVLNTLRPETYRPNSYHFDYLLVDEAAQASEPEVAVALAVVLPKTSTLLHEAEHRNRRIPQLVLCGDHMQLGPQISSEYARLYELDLSLVQRLFERPLYREHPKARHNLPAATGLQLLRPMITPAQYLVDEDSGDLLEPNDDDDDDLAESRFIGSSTDIDLSVPFCNLVNNYRSHPGLLMVPSALFYHDTLKPFAAQDIQNTGLTRWSQLKTNEIPLLVWHTDGQEEMFEEGASWYNELEVGRVVETIKDLSMGSDSPHGSIHPSEISVIAPFREQVSLSVVLPICSLVHTHTNVFRCGGYVWLSGHYS